MDETPESPRASEPTPRLGRFIAVAVAAFFVMVILGIVWVWQRAEREHRWREGDSEFFVPVRTNIQQP